MSKPKAFKLPPQKTNLIIYIQQHHQAIMAALLSTTASEMGYKVSDHTQLSLSDDYKTLTVSELEPNQKESPIVQAK